MGVLEKATLIVAFLLGITKKDIRRIGENVTLLKKKIGFYYVVASVCYSWGSSAWIHIREMEYFQTMP